MVYKFCSLFSMTLCAKLCHVSIDICLCAFLYSFFNAKGSIRLFEFLPSTLEDILHIGIGDVEFLRILEWVFLTYRFVCAHSYCGVTEDVAWKYFIHVLSYSIYFFIAFNSSFLSVYLLFF